MRRWAIFFVVYFSSIIACLNQYKVPPLMGNLMQQFQVDSVTAGWLMSIFALTGIILAFPAAVILRRVGPTISGLIAMGCTVLGCVIGAVSATSSMLMTARVIEGIGFALVCVISPAIIAMFFSYKEIALPMGILASWYPVGSTLAYNIAHPITEAFHDWRALWWVGAALALIAFILFATVVKRPAESDAGHGHGNGSISYIEGLKNPKIWYLGLSYLCILIGSVGFLTWAPKYFVDAFGLNPGIANFTASLGFMAAAPGGIASGIVLNKIKNRNIIVVICAVLSALTYTFGFVVPQGIMIAYLIVIGVITGFVSGAIWSIVPGAMSSPAFIGLGMGVISLMSSTANFIGTPAMGFVIADNQWSRSVIPAGIVQLIGVVFAIAFFLVKANSGKSTSESQQVKTNA